MGVHIIIIIIVVTSEISVLNLLIITSSNDDNIKFQRMTVSLRHASFDKSPV